MFNQKNNMTYNKSTINASAHNKHQVQYSNKLSFDYKKYKLKVRYPIHSSIYFSETAHIYQEKMHHYISSFPVSNPTYTQNATIFIFKNHRNLWQEKIS